MAEVSARPDAPGEHVPDVGARASIGMMLLGALAMMSCCILPIALVSLGITGVFIGKLSALNQYHWYFLAFAAGSLIYGFLKAYRPLNSEACADGTCARPMKRTVLRSVMWFSLLIVVAAVWFQYNAASILNPF